MKDELNSPNPETGKMDEPGGEMNGGEMNKPDSPPARGIIEPDSRSGREMERRISRGHMLNRLNSPARIKDSAIGWPAGIIIAYLVFIGGTLAFVFFTFTIPVNLVKADYYESTLTWQDQIDRVSRTMAMTDQVSFEISADRDLLRVHFPGEHVMSGISGRIHLFRPSDFRMDREVAILPDSLGWQVISVQGMQRGHWIMKVHWDAAGEEYYWQNDLYL